MSLFRTYQSLTTSFVGLPRRRTTGDRRSDRAARALAARRAQQAREELRNRVERDALHFPFR